MLASRPFVGKLQGVWGNLALLLHVLWNTEPGELVSLAVAQRASRIIDEFILPHAMVFYREMQGGEAQRNAKAIGAWLAQCGKADVAVHDLGRGPRCLRDLTPEGIVKQMGVFEAGGWLVPVKPGPGNRHWKVTPGIAAQFDQEIKKYNQAVQEILEKITGTAK